MTNVSPWWSEYAEDGKLTNLIKTYSEFISFPIEVYAKKQQSKEVEDVEATAAATEEFTKRQIEAEAKEEEFTEEAPAPTMKTTYEVGLVGEGLSHVACRMSHVACRMSHIACRMSPTPATPD